MEGIIQFLSQCCKQSKERDGPKKSVFQKRDQQRIKGHHTNAAIQIKSPICQKIVTECALRVQKNQIASQGNKSGKTKNKNLSNRYFFSGKHPQQKECQAHKIKNGLLQKDKREGSK